MEQNIDKYQVKRLIGRGGMAEVYEVESSGPGGFSKRLCIKKIRADFSARQDFVTLFETEARIVSRLQHTNIVQVFEFSRDNERRELYLVMEYVDGLDLNTILTEAAELGLQVPLDFAVYVLESLLSALQHAHGLKTGNEPTPVIHRDISPHNLLISLDGTVKLADFGIAKVKGMSEGTQTGVLKGKLAYMSPEQATGGRIPITPSSDLFSAGVLFWETVTCERLFQATMAQDILVKVLNFNDASLPYYSSQFNRFLSGLLAHDPQNRFSSAEAALRALRKIGILPCRKQDAAFLVQKIKVIRENAASARYAAESEHTKETKSERMPAAANETRTSSTVLPRASVNRFRLRRSWKRIGAAVGAAVLIGAVAGWLFVTFDEPLPASDIETSPENEAPPLKRQFVQAPVAPPMKPPIEEEPRPDPKPAIEAMQTAVSTSKEEALLAPQRTADRESLPLKRKAKLAVKKSETKKPETKKSDPTKTDSITDGIPLEFAPE